MRVLPFSNPFLALRSFERRDAARFYGRDSDLVLIKSRLYTARTTLLFAASGVGKTSLINARLVPVLEGSHDVVVHRLWASREPLRAVLAALGNPSVGDAPADPSASGDLSAALAQALAARAAVRPLVLVLDQFEEVFQHWRDSQALDTFAEGLSRVVNTPSLDVRVLLSMREEFLGELSVFDNLIPDLFGNSYRLKNPTRGEAEEIIERTAASEQGVACGPGLEGLLDDLMSMPGARNGSVAGQASTRRRIPMPFLQIVCHRLWEQQMRPRGLGATPAARFLEAHITGRASYELDHYCRETLDGLSEEEKDIAAAAFGLLMTPAGTKMAYPIDVLATQAEVPEERLAAVLATLWAPDTRILREVPAGAGGVPWVELYHDLYARFLSDWKRAHEQSREQARATAEQEAQNRRVQELVAEARAADARRAARRRRLTVLSPALVAVLLFAVKTGFDYRNHFSPLRQFALEASIAPGPDAYARAQASVDTLSPWSLFSLPARSLWAQYWNQRAQREMLAGHHDYALLSLVRSLGERDQEHVRRQLTDWLSLGEPLRTFHLGQFVAAGDFDYLVGADRVYTLGEDCAVAFWNREDPDTPTTWSPAKPNECHRVIALSPDGAYAVLHRRADGRAVIIDVKTKAETWSGLPDSATVDASFSQDGHVVVSSTAGAAVVSLLDGKPSNWALPKWKPVGLQKAKYYFSRFSNSLAVQLPDRVVVVGASGAPVWEVSPRKVLANTGFEDEEFVLLLLPGDRVWAVFRKGIAEISPAGVSTILSSRGTIWHGSGRASVAVTPDGQDVWVRESADRFCRISIARPGCEPFLVPIGDIEDSVFHATSHETLFLQISPGESGRLVEFRMKPDQRRIEPSRGSVRLSSDNGRWALVDVDAFSENKQCLLVDLSSGGSTRIDASCQGFEFSSTGAHVVREEGAGLKYVDSTSLVTTVIPLTRRIMGWASDEHLHVANGDQHTLLKVSSGQEQTFSDQPDVREFGGPCSGPLARVSSDQRSAVLSERGGLVLYRSVGNVWNRQRPIPNSNSCDASFSHDGSRFVGLVNGNVVSVWRSSDGVGVRSLSDNFEGLTEARFAFGRDWVVALSDKSEFLVWRVDGSELPTDRVSLPRRRSSQWPSWPRLLLDQSQAQVALLADRMIVWVETAGSSKVALDVTPVPWSSSLNEARLAPEGVRVVVSESGNTWTAPLVSRTRLNVAPYALAASLSWSDLYRDWSRRLAMVLDEGSGRYEVRRRAATPSAENR